MQDKLRLMATSIRKSTTANNVSDKYAEIRDVARKLKQLVKEVCVYSDSTSMFAHCQ